MNGKENLPLISIALCVYNGERFLREQLESLVKQTYRHIEIIAVDDCSTDSSLEILREFAAAYPFLHIIQNEKNLGYTKNFEKALSLCRGEWVALSDQDDIWELDKLSQQAAGIGAHTLIYHDSAFIDEEGKALNKKMSDVINLYQGDQPEVFLFFNCVSGHTCFFRKELLKEVMPFPDGLFHDHWIAYVATNLGSIKVIPECLVRYRQHSSTSTDILNKRKKLDKSYHENRDVTKLKKELKWLKQCQSFRLNKNQAFLDQFVLLFENRIDSFFSYDYAMMIRTNFDTLYFIQKLRKSSRSGFISRQIWGLKAKIIWGRLFG